MITAILLAAGKSKRMLNENKLCKKFIGLPLICHSVKNILSSSVDELIIVLGHDQKTIRGLIKKNNKVKFVYNNKYETGMASSIKKGIANLSHKTDAFFICLGDMPLVRPDIYNKLILSLNDHEIVVPNYKNQQGNPVLFSISMKEKIMTLSGDTGAKKILKNNKEKIINLPINDSGILKNFNTSESFNT